MLLLGHLNLPRHDYSEGQAAMDLKYMFRTNNSIELNCLSRFLCALTLGKISSD